MSFKIKIQNPIEHQKIADVAGLCQSLLQVMDYQNQLTVSHIQRDYASFPKDGPATMDGLRVISGRLRSSYTASEARVDDAGIISDIGSNVVYAGIQEFGGQTSAHDIVARNGKALCWPGPGGKMIFAKVVHHPGSDIPARQPIQRGIEDRLPEYSAAFELAINQFIRN